MTWDHRYRRLEEGEIIETGDECLTDADWMPANCIGERAPDPNYTSHRWYRRLVRQNTGRDEMSDILARKPWNDGRDGDWINEAAAEIERLTRELAEARAQTQQAVREALEEAYIAVSDNMRNNPDYLQHAPTVVRKIIARLDAEEPKP